MSINLKYSVAEWEYRKYFGYEFDIQDKNISRVKLAIAKIFFNQSELLPSKSLVKSINQL